MNPTPSMADDSTAVVRIRENFYDFISGCPSSKDSNAKRLKFDTSSKNSTLETVDLPGKDQLLSRSEVVAAKSEVIRLQAELSSKETQLSEAKLAHEAAIKQLKVDNEREIFKHADTKNQLLTLLKKETEQKRERFEMKQEIDKLRDSQKSVSSLQRDRVVLQSELEQARHDLRDATYKLELESKNLVLSLKQCQKQQEELDELHLTLRSSTERKSFLEQETEDLRSLLSNSSMKVRELEKMIAQFEEDGKVVQMMKAKLTQMKQFEDENKSLREENQYLSAIQMNTHLLTEEKNNLMSRLDRLQQQFVEMSKYQVLSEELQKRLAKWESLDETNAVKSPQLIRQQTAELQREVRQLLEKNGQLQANMHSLEEAHKTLISQLENAKAETASASMKLQETNDLLRRLRKKLIFVNEENKLFRNIIDKYNNHDDDLTSRIDVRANIRIQHLEKLVEKHEKQVLSLQTDLDKTSEELTQFKAKAFELEYKLEKQTIVEPIVVPVTNSVDQDIILCLRQKVEELEKSVEKQTEEKEEALAQMERIDIQGGYDRSKTRVFHYRMNPYSMSSGNQRQELEHLREENVRLNAKLNAIKETGGPVEGLSVIADENVCTTKELQDAKQQLVSEQLKNQRLMEAFQKKSRELREVNYKVLGYRVDMPDSDEFRLMSMYAETPNDFFIFKQSPNGELQLLANQYSESFQKNVDTYLSLSNSLPAFMSSVTLELHSRQTVMQTS